MSFATINLFYNILGSMHNEKQKENHREGSEGIKEMPKGRIYDKPSLNGYVKEQKEYGI